MTRRVRSGDDDGFALLFVLFVTTMVMIGVATVLTIVTPNIRNSKSAQDTSGALAAAQSGVDDVIAYLTSIPSCRSETRICTQALGASSTALNGTSRQRPSLGGDQTYVWTTASSATADGYVRVTSTGTANGTSRVLVADLSLQPSILSYGYYSDYETQPGAFFSDYYAARAIRMTNSTVYGNVNSNIRGDSTVPQTATWNAPVNTARCNQHWYFESSAVQGRNKVGTTWSQTGSLNNNGVDNTSRSGVCDLVFTTGMVEDGKTYTRDAYNISAAGGSGPVFNQPVFTMWGYDDGTKKYTDPKPPARPWRGDDITNSPYIPAKAEADLVLPDTIGKDGISENSCVYFGPTRVKLNGDGTATVTSPDTTAPNAESDPRCYPGSTLPSTGIVGFKLNYQTIGSGTIIVKDLGTKPTAGWPDNQTKSIQKPSASNEVLYLPAATTPATADPSTSASPSTCSSTAYSAAVSSVCAWTNLRSATDGGSSLGWTSYGTGNCNSNPATKDRLLFECEYSQTTGATRPSADQYASFRGTVQNALANGTCVGGTIADQVSCVQNSLNANVLPAGNTARHAYDYATPASRDRRYYAVTASAASSTGTTRTQGSTPTNPTADDPFFTFSGGTPAKQTSTLTPITTTVYRQTYASGRWGTGVAQFTFTITHTDWDVTQATGASYFPNPLDITEYNSGAAAANSTTPSGSTGALQPGDLYVDGANKGKLSLVAQNDVIVTGNVTNPANYKPEDHAVSIVAENNVRNYHPMSCVEQNADAIDKTAAGWCPNDITALSSNTMIDSNGFTASHPARQYTNINGTGDRTIEAAIFTLAGSLRTDNYDRGVWVGNLNIHGGIYQSHRGANGVQYQSGQNIARSGTTLQYSYVDLQRAELPYIPPATSGNYSRPWNVVSLSAGGS